MIKQALFAVLVFLSTFFSAQNRLSEKIDSIAGKNATVAVSVKGIDFPFEFNNAHAELHLPMQSVFKFHIALTVLQFADEGKLRLNQNVFVSKKDFLPDTWSPIREKYPKGNVWLPLSEILYYTVAMSDNNGCDILLRLIGGPRTVQKFMNAKGVHDFQIKYNEEQMHNSWEFQFENYTTSASLTDILDKFYHRKILSASSTKWLMKTMLNTTTGTNKLKAGLPENTPIAHKTGSSGKNKNGITAAENDMGIITLPNGKHYAIAVLVSNTSQSETENCRTTENISQAVWDFLN